MRNVTRAAILGAAGFFVLAGAPATVQAAAPPEIFSVIEGRDTATDRPVLVLLGQSLTKFSSFTLKDTLDVPVPGAIEVLLKSKTMLVLGLPQGTPAGEYELTAALGTSSSQTYPVKVGNGAPLPGSVEGLALSPELQQDLGDAETLGGQAPSFYRDAANINAGTVSPDRFSAYADLLAEAKVGTASNQVAAGNHEHDAVYAKRADLATPGTLNDSGNLVDWTRLKGVPADLADGADSNTTYGAGDGLGLAGTTFSVLYAGNGAATTSARSDHDHDARYPMRGDLSAPGTINQAGNPMDWTKLKGVPSGFADGTDNDTTYAAGEGLSLSGGAFSVNFFGSGTLPRAARSDHDHDSRYFTQAQLGSAGTINDSGNPVDWTRLKGVPAGIADGTDSDTTYTAGAGLVLSGTQFSVGTVGWSSLTDLPSGFADGVDDDTTYTAGAGLSLSGTEFSLGSVPWSSLTGMPAGFADGVDDNAWTESGGNATRSSGRVGIGTSAPSAALHVSGTDGVVFGGTFLTGSFPASGAGVRMMWYPAKAAFRAGSVTGGQWDVGSIGLHSTALGGDTTASGSYSTAHGYSTVASGQYSTAMGAYAVASNLAATAMGSGAASGQLSTAMGAGTTASGNESTALGNGTTASGQYSTAMGAYSTASGQASTAMGDTTTASGGNSTAMGSETTAAGANSTAMGLHTTAQAEGSLVLGQYNVVEGSTNSWVSTEPVLVVGNGSYGSPSNALTLLKNGNLTVAGTFTATGGVTGIPTSDALSTAGTINVSTNPVDWTKLKGVPTGIADGTDSDTTYAAGTGLALAGTTFSVDFGGTGSASTASRSDHDHDTRYFTETELSAAGTINTSTNPVDWSKLKNVPSGFSDGTDSDTTYTAGSGLTLSTGAFSVAFAGTGSAATSARSDHNHDVQYFTETELSAAGTINTSTNPVDWSKLKNVPAGLADGVDNNAWTESGGDAYRNTTGHVGIGTASPSASLHVEGNDGALFRGSLGTGALPATGTGVRMLWYPKKAAFRSGLAGGTEWDDASIGTYSVATGAGTKASGFSSTAIGNSTTASGDLTLAAGYQTSATNTYATSLGWTTTASGTASTAMGSGTTASGNRATAMGSQTTAQAYASLALGEYNVVAGNSTTWVATDPVLVVGNGTSTTPSNAFTLLKNGNLSIPGRLTATGGITVDGTDGVLFGGTSGSGTLAATGAGVRMLWYPRKGAFRAGIVSGTQWDDTAIGSWSAALGSSTTANGFSSTALGSGTQASGFVATAIGGSTAASGNYATATGYTTTASGTASTAMGWLSSASGEAATALGKSTSATGINSTAMGDNSTASGTSSTAAGYGTTASNKSATAMGHLTTASGWYSTAMGFNTTAQAAYSVVLGEYNVAAGNATSWISTDPVLVVGNGTSTTASNAFTLLKNGNLTIAGTLTENSDARLKADIAPLTGVLARLTAVRGVSYRFKDAASGPSGPQIGLLAQEVRDAFPELVREDSEGKLSVAYGNFAAVLLQAVKEQQEALDAKDLEVAALRKELEAARAATEERLAKLEALLSGGAPREAAAGR